MVIKLKKANFLAVFLFAFLFCFLTDGTVKAANITSSPLTTIPNSNTEISAKYDFVPTFNEDTTISSIGGNGLWKTRRWNASDNSKWLSINVHNKEHLKGEIGVRYRNVGNYDGNVIDLVITVNDWKDYRHTTGNISFGKEEIAVSTQGYDYTDMTWEFVKSGTNTPVKVSGYMTIGDLDLWQGIKFSKTTSNAIDKIMIANRNNKISYRNDNGELWFYDATGIDSPDNLKSDLYRFTFFYKNQSQLRFKWTKDHASQGSSKGYVSNPNNAGGEYFFYELDKPARTKISSPIKRIDQGSKEVTSNTISNINSTLKYKVQHTVPQEDPKYYFNNYKVTDTINSALDITKVEVLNQVGENVSNKFTTSIKGNTVTVTAKSSTLRNPEFYGETYEFIYHTKPNKGKLNSIFNGSTMIKNQATLRINGRSYSTNEVQSKIYQRVLTINHIDKDTGKLIQTETEKVYDGEKYNVSPRTDLKRGSYSYKPASTNTQNGTINGKNVTIDFYYTVPKMTVGIDKVQIYTDNVTPDPSDGLPTNIYLEKDLKKDSKLEDFDGGKVTVEILDKNSSKQVYSKIFDIEKLNDKHQLKLPTNYLSEGEKIQYTINLTIADNGTKNYELVSETPKIQTHGYTSSEKVLSSDDLVNGTIDYTGVIMTEKEIDKNVVEHKEKLSLDIPNIPKQKTGYGFETKISATYSNDLGDLAEIKTDFFIDNDLIDSYISYPSQNGMAKISMDKTKQVPSSNGKTISLQFELPHVNVERYTGNVFTDKQVSNNDSRIKHEILDGGRKIYIPIWADLGDYDYIFQSKDHIGVNEVTFDIEGNINVYAHMYGHIDSETIEEDEILITPVDPQDPFPNGKPKDWTDEDIEWLQE